MQGGMGWMLPFVSFSAYSVLFCSVARDCLCGKLFFFFPPLLAALGVPRATAFFYGRYHYTCLLHIRSQSPVLYDCIYNLSITSIVTIMEAYIALLREDVNMRGPLTLSLDLDAHPTGFLLAMPLAHGHASRS